ncbi:MAG: YraN family protein [Anaerolineae bacterium]|nr:YraN family protein [Anaerolineae bacterium]
MPHLRQTLGQRGEDFVAAELRRTGYTILARNWRHGKHGELDIVARYGQGGVIVFVEVRTRRGPVDVAVEQAFASVNARKRAQLLRLADAFLAAHDLHQVDWRITIAAVGYEHGTFTLEVCKDAIAW